MASQQGQLLFPVLTIESSSRKAPGLYFLEEEIHKNSNKFTGSPSSIKTIVSKGLGVVQVPLGPSLCLDLEGEGSPMQYVIQ